MIDKEAYIKISNGATPANFNPSVQILGIDRTSNGYQLDLTDGEANFQALYLGCKLKEALDSNRITSNHIIKLIDYCFNQAVDVPLIIFDFEEQLRPLSEFKSHSQDTGKTPSQTMISDLLSSSKWELKVRVLEKASIKDYRHSNDIGKYFKIIVIDSAGDQAEIVFFGAKVEEYFELVQKGRVYAISQGVVSPPHPNYRKEGILFEIRSNRETRVFELEDDKDIPKQSAEKVLSLQKPNDYAGLEDVKPDQNKKNVKKIFDFKTFEQLHHMKSKTDCKVNVYVLCTLGKLSLSDSEAFWYQGCPVQKCKRKVTALSIDKFYCPYCQKNYQNSTFRYRVLMPMHDSTGSYTVKIFDNYAEQLFKISAQELQYISQINHEKAEGIALALFGKKIIAEVQVAFTGGNKDVVLVRTRPAEEALESLLEDIDSIARISFPESS